MHCLYMANTSNCNELLFANRPMFVIYHLCIGSEYIIGIFTFYNCTELPKYSTQYILMPIIFTIHVDGLNNSILLKNKLDIKLCTT